MVTELVPVTESVEEPESESLPGRVATGVWDLLRYRATIRDL
jgi:hypothetical protein